MGISFKKKIIASTALAAALLSGYMRRSYAAPCVEIYADTRVCYGDYTDAISFTGERNFTLQAGSPFSINVDSNKSHAIELSGYGALSFLDKSRSYLISRQTSTLVITNNGDHEVEPGKNTPGSINIALNSFLRSYGEGSFAIDAYNKGGTGDVSISMDGDIASYYGGIRAINGDKSNGDLIISLGKGSKVTTDQGIALTAYNFGAGKLHIMTDGSISSHDLGISAINKKYSAADLIIETAEGSSVTSRSQTAIRADNQGQGDLRIDVAGDVHGSSYAIYALNAETSAAGLHITVREKSLITADRGVTARNLGLGTSNISIYGDIITDRDSVNIYNTRYSKEGLNILTGKNSRVETLNGSAFTLSSYGARGIYLDMAGDIYAYGTAVYARNEYGGDIYFLGRDDFYAQAQSHGVRLTQAGDGKTTVTLNGDIAVNEDGIFVYQSVHSHGDVTVTTGHDSVIEAGHGIWVQNQGYGGAYLNLEGDVYAFTRGVYLSNERYAKDLRVRVGADSNITAKDKQALTLVNRAKSNATVDVYGAISGAYGLDILSYGTDLIITSRSESSIEGVKLGIKAENLGSGSLDIYAGGLVRGGSSSIVALNYGDGLSVTVGSRGYIYSGDDFGLNLRQGGSGDTTVDIEGHVKSGAGGVIVMTSSGKDLNVHTTGDSKIEASGHGVVLHHQASGGLAFRHYGSIVSGGHAIAVSNMGGASIGIVTDGIIESTGGYAIRFYDDQGGYALNTAATPIEIAGGRIIGDVIDNYQGRGFSPVTVTGDFVSEGNFRVSSFRVADTADFTLGADNLLDSYSGIQVDGVFNVDNARSSTRGGGFTVNAAGRLNVREDFEIVSDFTNNGITHIATGKNLVVDTMSAGTGDLYFGFNTSADHALLTVANGAANLTGQTLHIDVTGVSGLADNEQALLVTGNGAIIGGPGGTRAAVHDSSVLWDFEIVDGTASVTPTTNADLFLVAKQAATIPQLATTPNNVAVGNVLMSVQNTPDPQLASVVANMNGASTGKDFNEVLESVQPGADMSEAAVMRGFSERMMETISDRLEILRGTGVQSLQARLSESAGYVPETPGLQAWTVNFGDQDSLENAHGLDAIAGKQWQSGFGRYSRQKARNGIDGYKAITGGAAIGIDTGKTYSDMIIGIAASYARSEIDADNANRTQTDIQGFQVLAYATKLLPKDSYIDLILSYAQNQNDVVRHDVGGVAGLTAKGDFTSRETGIKTSIGRHFSYNDFMISPSFKVDWLHYTADSYTETGAGGAGLSVKTNSLDSVEVGAAVKVSKAIKKSNGAVWLPEIHAGYSYDLIGDPLQKSAQFIGGGASFTSVSPEPARHRVNAGFGVTYGATNDWDYSLTYNLDTAKGYQAHSLMARAAWNF